MKRHTLSERFFTGDYLIFFFYLFMMVCGFAAGTKIWSSNDSIIRFSCDNLYTHVFSDILTMIALPPLAVLALSSVLALFAGGWILLPLVIYTIGAGAGYAGCIFFSEGHVSVLTAFAAAYFCCFAVIIYACVYSHTLSRVLSCGGNCRTAYKKHAKGIVVSIVLIIITAFVFSTAIYCSFSAVK